MPSMANALDDAIAQDLSEYRFASIRSVAAVYGLAPFTLRRRLNNGLSRRESHANEQLLSLISPPWSDRDARWSN